MSAKTVAEDLAYQFLKSGSYGLASGSYDVPGLMHPHPVAAGEDVDEAVPFGAFAGLAVQSVGYEEGNQDPKVHIYVLRGSAKILRALSAMDTEVPIRVNKMGPVSVKPEATARATNRGYLFTHNNRVCCGSSCAPTCENYAGTLGALVRKRGQAQIYAMSNNHVFAACNHVPVGTPILAPSNMDGRAGTRAPGEICRHSEIHELRSGEPTLVLPCAADVAIAHVPNPAAVSSYQGDPAAGGYDTPTTVCDPQSGMRVKKVGRTTALSTGTVEALINTPMALPYKARHFTATVWFKNVWTVRADPGQPFALPGDSGSLVVTEDNSHAVGLVFAANPGGDYGWMIPMHCVIDSFGQLELVGNHGV